MWFEVEKNHNNLDALDDKLNTLYIYQRNFSKYIFINAEGSLRSQL